LKITVIGACNIDIIGRSNQNLIPDNSNIGKISLSVGGVAKNIAQFLSSFGIKTNLISAIPNSSFGKIISRDLSKNKIDFTNSKFGFFDDCLYLSIEDHHGNMLGAINQMKSIDLLDSSFLQSKKEKILNVDMVVIDTNLSQESIEFLANLQGRKYLAVEGVSCEKVQKIRNIYDKIDLLKLNEAEAKSITQKNLSYKNLAHQILSKGVKQVHITLGEKGVVFGDKNQIFYRPVKKLKNILSVNKAGDAYFAGVIYKFLQKKSLQESVDFALKMSKKQLLGEN